MLQPSPREAEVLAEAKLEFEENPRHNAHAVGWGYREVNGVPQTHEPPVLVISVVKKHTEHEMRAAGNGSLIVPKRYNGVDTDIVEEPRFKAFPRIEAVTGEELRVCFKHGVPGGAQVKPINERWVGTGGIMVHFKYPDGKNGYGILTNAHVAGMKSKIGTLICQPEDPKRIGALHSIGRLRFNDKENRNRYDAAIVDCWNGSCHLCVPTIHGVGAFSSTPRDMQLGDKVFKVGRTTGYQSGIVTRVSVATGVEHDPGEVAYFDEQIIIKRADGGNFSDAGDSGSAIMHFSDKSPAGLLHAGGGNATIASQISHVMQGMQFDFDF